MEEFKKRKFKEPSKSPSNKSPSNKSPSNKRPFNKSSSNKNQTKILAYCHSLKYTTKKIIDELKFDTTNCVIDTNDLPNNNEKDITIDLSKKILNDKEDISNTEKNKYKTSYNIIYLVNCPSDVYITDNNFNSILFSNLYKLLINDGLLITRLSDDAIETLLKYKLNDDTFEIHPLLEIDGEYFNNEKARILSTEEINIINLKIIEEKKNIVLKVRKLLIEFLNLHEKEFKFVLLNDTDNKKYIKKNDFQLDENIEEFFILKKKELKIEGGNKKKDKKIYTGPKGGKYTVSIIDGKKVKKYIKDKKIK